MHRCPGRPLGETGLDSVKRAWTLGSALFVLLANFSLVSPPDLSADEPAPTWGQAARLDSCIPASVSCIPRNRHFSVPLLNGEVLVGGGVLPGTGFTATAQIYDPGTNTWRPTGSLVAAGSLENFYDTPAATLIPDGRVFVQAKDCQGSNCTYRPQTFNPATGQWTATSAPEYDPVRRSTTTLLEDGRVLVAGGTAPSATLPVTNAPVGLGGELGSAQIYDPRMDDWTLTGDMEDERAAHSAVLLDGPNCGERCGKVLAARRGNVELRQQSHQSDV